MEQKTREYQTVLLSALLHDVGKLWGQGAFTTQEKGQHPRFSVEFVDTFADIFASVTDIRLLNKLVQRHHDDEQHFDPEFLIQNIEDRHERTLATVINRADKLSSAQPISGFGQWQDYLETPLVAVLERVNHVDKGDMRFRYHAQPLKSVPYLDVIFPGEFPMFGREELAQHAARFREKFHKFLERKEVGALDTNNFECAILQVLSLLHEYGWCIPSNVQETVPDVSLYDHLKTTAAVASCLYLYHADMQTLDEKEVGRADVNRFCLVAGDLSGIQRYIFDIAGAGVGGGVARRLRSRSFFIQITAEIASHLILNRLGLSIGVHTIMNSGGRFYLLLPNLPQVKAILHEVAYDVDNWFLKLLNGELALNLAYVDFADTDLELKANQLSGFGKIMGRLNVALSGQKQNRFVKALCPSQGWSEDSFVIEEAFHSQNACISCRKFPEVEDGLCSYCRLDQDIGALLPDTKYVAFFNSPAGMVPVLGYSVSLLTSWPASFQQEKPYLVMKLNDPDLTEILGYPAMSKYLATFVAKADNCEICKEARSPIATFECIAGRSNGQKLLGFLKVDVDQLGESLIFGLKSDKSAIDTMSRISTLSRMLDLFFAGWVEFLARESSSIYTVFSGGDDLFLVGPWDTILELVEKIRADFGRFTGNPSLTISAGVTIARHDLPVASATRLTEEALEQSKQQGRDRITILGSTLTWSDWERVKSEWQYLRHFVGQASSAFLYSLIEFSTMWLRYRKTGDTLGLRYHPLLAYSISRNLDPKRTPELCAWADKILALRPGNRDHEIILDNLGLIASLLIYSKRGGGQ